MLKTIMKSLAYMISLNISIILKYRYCYLFYLIYFIDVKAGVKRV